MLLLTPTSIWWASARSAVSASQSKHILWGGIMSKVEVTVQSVSEIHSHPNADRLEIAIILGWNCIVAKGNLKPGDLVVYFPIDSVLPDDLIEKLFKDSKVKPDKGRIRTIKLRGAISQGLAIPADQLLPVGTRWKVGTDVTERLGVTKYEPPETKSPGSNMQPSPKRNQNENFKKYTDIEHLKKYPAELEGREVIVQEKVHGTNFRAGWCPRPARSFWERMLEKIGFWKDRWEFCWGSHNVQLQRKGGSTTSFHQQTAGCDVYTEAVRKYNLEAVLPKGVQVFGEIFGDGVQRNFPYGCKAGERKTVFFDVLLFGEYVPFKTALLMFEQFKLPVPPVLYNGIFDMQKIEELCTGASELAPEQPVIEGGVIRPIYEGKGYMGRLIFKYLNPDYLLLKDNTEHH
jgi:RNA ligase (TIGR02306 family)